MLGRDFLLPGLRGGAGGTAPERTKVLVEALRGLGDVMVVIIDLVMTVAPYGVFDLALHCWRRDSDLIFWRASACIS